MKKYILIFILIFLYLPHLAISQKTREFHLFDNWSFNVNGGASLFWGDLREYKFYPVNNYESERNLAYGFVLSKQLNSIFHIRGQLIKGNLSGTRRTLNSYFNAEFNEYIVNATIDFSRIIFGDKPDRKLTMYGIGGIGFIDFRSLKKELVSNKYIDSRGYTINGSLKESHKMVTETIIPFGFGVKYNLSSRLALNFENIWSIANTDFIDVSGANNFDVNSGGFKYDFLTYTSFGLTFKFSQSEKEKKIPLIEPTDEITEDEPIEIIKNESKNTESEIKTETKDIETAVKDDSETIEPVKIIKAEPKTTEPEIKNETKHIETVLTDESKAIETTLIIKNKIAEKPEFDYEFRVQVFASFFKANMRFIKKYNISEPITEDFNGVLYTYSVGSFKTYTEAKAKAYQLITENKAYGAFVIGIKGNKRLYSLIELLSNEEKAALKVSSKKK